MKWEGQEESKNVEDRRGMRAAAPALAGGGLIVMLIAYFLGVDPRIVNQFMKNVAPQQQAPAGGQGQAVAPDDRTAKFTRTVMRFTEKVWGDVFRESGKRYIEPKMVLFSDAVATNGCGQAPSSVGPFYCPADQTVYLDPTFFDELEKKLGGSKAEFSQAYVIAHEVGHHVQNLLGYSDIVNAKRRQLPEVEFNKWSVRLELQADYLAGVWAHYGQKEFRFLESGDVEAAVKSANAIGDDRLQKRSQGWVSPEGFTHGTSEQRIRWFRLGLDKGDLSGIKEVFDLPYERL
jgi:hypothetical protein